MILGILSDTHGRAAIARDALRLLRETGAEFFIHCGDLGDDVLNLLPRGASAFVFGNNDYDHRAMIEAAHALDVRCLRSGGVVTLDGKQIAVTHGDEPRLVNAYLRDPAIDYLLSGHSHVPHDRRVGKVRRINPGALYRAPRKTVATLDLTTDVVTFHEVREQAR